MKSLTAFVIGCIFFVVIYVITDIAVQCVTGMPLDSALTAGVFGLFGTELAVTGFIKIFKIKKE